jgi:hypothetical protein
MLANDITRFPYLQADVVSVFLQDENRTARKPLSWPE